MLKKSLGFWRTWALVVGMMIGSSVFLLPAVLAPYGSFSLIGWIVATTGTLFVALSLGAMARRIPKIGKRLHPRGLWRSSRLSHRLAQRLSNGRPAPDGPSGFAAMPPPLYRRCSYARAHRSPIRQKW